MSTTETKMPLAVLDGAIEAVTPPMPNANAFTTPDGMKSEFAKFKRAVLANLPATDLNTKKGRDAIASYAFRVARSKTLVDGMRKDMVAEVKAKIAVIDANGKYWRDNCDALRNQIRKPLDDWEFAEAERIRIEKEEAERIRLSLEAAAKAEAEKQAAEAAAIAQIEASHSIDEKAPTEAAQQHAQTIAPIGFDALMDHPKPARQAITAEQAQTVEALKQITKLSTDDCEDLMHSIISGDVPHLIFTGVIYK